MSESEIYITAQKIDSSGEIEKRQIPWDKLPEQYKMSVNPKRCLYFYDNGQEKKIITEEKFKELNKLLNPRPRFKLLRFIAAWLVMEIISMLFCVVGAFLIGLIMMLIEKFVINEIFKIVLYVVLSPTLLAITFNPMLFGAYFSITTSNKILESPKGTRYIVYGIYLFVFGVLALTTDIIITQSVVATAFKMLYGLILIYGRHIEYSE